MNQSHRNENIYLKWMPHAAAHKQNNQLPPLSGTYDTPQQQAFDNLVGLIWLEQWFSTGGPGILSVLNNDPKYSPATW